MVLVDSHVSRFPSNCLLRELMTVSLDLTVTTTAADRLGTERRRAGEGRRTEAGTRCQLPNEAAAGEVAGKAS